MSTIDVEMSVGQLVVEQPNLSRVFDKFGINYCCSGKLSLREACAENGLDPALVVQELDSALETRHVDSRPQTDWTNVPLGQLCDHIEGTYHHYLAEELPRLTAMVDKVAHVHGQRLPSLYEVHNVFTKMRDELVDHTAKEHEEVYPRIRALDTSGADRSVDSVAAVIGGLQDEHKATDAYLVTLRSLTNNYIPSHDACRTHRAVLAGLEELERETYDHMHKENNILFPRAIATEQDLQQ